MREIPVFDQVDDCPHRPTEDPTYQESSLFVWRDMATGFGGFWRIGQEPVVGKLSSCFGVFTADGLRFRSNVSGAPMSPGDRSDRHMGWGDALRVDLDTLSIEARFTECEVSLRFHDFYPRYHYHVLTGRPLPSGHLGRHFEIAGALTGAVRIGDTEFDVDALGYRDRSWGPRRWDTLRCTRWWPAVFGPDLCMHLSVSVHEGGLSGPNGYVIRNGAVEAITAADFAVTLDPDGIGPRAGQARFTTEGGDYGEVLHQRSDGILLNVRGYTAVESVGVARWRERIGMSNLEVSTNPAGGTQFPAAVIAANHAEGLTRWVPGAELIPAQGWEQDR